MTSVSMPHGTLRQSLVAAYFGFYYIVFGFFAINNMLLSQYHPIFFNFNRDLAELMILGSGLPHFMMMHPWTFLLADTLLYSLPLLVLGYYLRKGRFSIPLGIAFTAFLALYLLLSDIFLQIHLEPYIVYLLLSLFFISNREDRSNRILGLCRYYFCYIFVSAALWKIFRGAIFNIHELSNILIVHHNDVLYSKHTTFFSSGFYYLIDHPVGSYLLYLAGTLLEASFVIGFFTRKADKWLFSLAVLFVLADVLVMRIPYWTILIGGIPLLVDFEGSPKTIFQK